jgi:Zn-dependent M28 family amino/carboxypeptidase
LRQAVTVEAVFAHMVALDNIATANGGERASGTPGYQASVDYVVGLLGPAGYQITVQPFDFPFFDEPSPSELERVSPDPKVFVNGTDFATMTYSGAGNATGTLQAIDVLMPPTGGSTSGCEVSDFAGFAPGNVALIQRGTCSFQLKAQNAEAAGASAVIVYNEGNNATRVDLFFGTLGEPGVNIPVLSTSFAVGDELYNNTIAGPTTVRVFANTISQIRETYNVFAETPEGKPQSVMMFGAHLDSVLDSPGMNDDASGTAALLEIALQMSELGIEPRNKLRFAFWGAEELGLLGSDYYVSTLSPTELNKIKMYLNYDVIGSLNGFPFVYTPQAGDGTPAASAEATRVFNDYFASVGLPRDPTPLLGGSDHVPFLVAGVPAGGLFSGATGIKTMEQAAAYGGTAGEPYDELINSPGDVIERINQDVLDDMSDAAAHGVFWYAFRTPAQDRARGRSAPAISELTMVPHK